MPKYAHPKNCKCQTAKVPLSKRNPWWINAPTFHNCFWTYFRYNSHVHTLSEIATLMQLSISAITSIEKKAFAKIRQKVKSLNIEEP